MIKSITVEVNLENEEWTLFQESVFDIPMTLEDARKYIKEEAFSVAFHIYTDSALNVDILVNFEDTVCYKVTYHETNS